MKKEIKEAKPPVISADESWEEHIVKMKKFWRKILTK